MKQNALQLFTGFSGNSVNQEFKHPKSLMPFCHFSTSTLAFSYTENKYSVEHPCINNKNEPIASLCSQTYGQNTVFEYNKGQIYILNNI